ncbi:hypothetical protein RDI58_014673 [Solanum bulbocastanum]|uniref:Uncharacterized protein n=1 Tax=Solanum bulbocastanum TaxID=147425 RepID=A0AAN8YE62_SOLBU
MWFSLKLNTHCGCDVIQPVPTKLVLQKKIAGEEKSNNEVEHFPNASRVTVRKRPTVTAIEKEGVMKPRGYTTTLKGQWLKSEENKISHEDVVGKQLSMHD